MSFRPSAGWTLWAVVSIMLVQSAGAEVSEPAQVDEVDTPSAMEVSDENVGSAIPAETASPSRTTQWSATFLGRISGIDSDDDSNEVGGFFDRFDAVPNKGGALPIEIGPSDLQFDLFEGDEALLQIRYSSPTSNLGLTEKDAGDWFLNQRAAMLGRLDGLQLDLDYYRFRTEELRVFPNTGGSALPFTDLTGTDDRFDRTRTGFFGEFRLRPADRFQLDRAWLSHWSPEIAFRGGFESRSGTRQFRTILNPGNDWIALGQNVNQEVGRVGTGLRVHPTHGFTMRLDFDHEAFRPKSSKINDASLPFPSNGRTVGFIPSSDRSTGKLRLSARIGDRLDLRGGFQITRLEQTDQETPSQDSAGFDGPKILTYIGNARARLAFGKAISSRAWVKVAHRDNDMDRHTALFNSTNGTQVDEFLRRSTRIDAGVETSARLHRALRVSLGADFKFLDRDLDFASRGLGNLIINPAVALADDESISWRLYGKMRLRPGRGLKIRAKLGYQGAPSTGYVVELDEYVFGNLKASYALPLELTRQRTVMISGEVRGGTGKNRDFDLRAGVGTNPTGPNFDRDYDRTHWTTGFSVDTALRDDLSLSGSIFFRRDDQESNLALSNLQRYFQETVPISFRSPGDLSSRTDELSMVLGVRYSLSQKTTLGAAYSYVRSNADYGESDSSPELDLIDANREIDSAIHGLDLSMRHRLRPGLEMRLGYLYQRYEDDAGVPVSAGSRVAPFDYSADRHAVTFGVTLNSDFYAAD
jgi:hypothetical protein